MDFKQLVINVSHLKEIVNTQVQVRTNKLKPYVEMIEEAVNDLTPTSEVSEDMDDRTPGEKIDSLILSLTDEERIFLQNKLSVGEESDPDLAKENKYLKRKQTMYDLKISKLENEIKEQKALLKGEAVK